MFGSGSPVELIYRGGKWIYKGIDKLHRGPREKAAAQAEMRFQVRRIQNMVGTAIRHKNQQMAVRDPNQTAQTQTGLDQDQAVVDGKILGMDLKVLIVAGIGIAFLLRR